MDPNECLSEIRAILTDFDGFQRGSNRQAAERLAELIDALDDWLSHGGFLPSDWRPRPGASQSGLSS